jgi:hypothetical protein
MTGRLYKFLLVGLALVLLASASWTQQKLNAARTQMGLTRLAPLENAPPVLAFTTVALGSFRGLIANALWIRATELSDEGKYFEMVQLADWITKLQPHFSAVWVNQAQGTLAVGVAGHRIVARPGPALQSQRTPHLPRTGLVLPT